MISDELLEKLTKGLAGDLDTYNQLLSEVQTQDDEIKTVREEKNKIEEKLKATETRADDYLRQINNLLSKISIGSTKDNTNYAEQLKEYKNKKWERESKKDD